MLGLTISVSYSPITSPYCSITNPYCAMGIKYSQPGNKTFPALFVDQSSVEIFTAEGTMSLTNLVFPSSIYNQLTVEGAMSECQVRKLNRVW